MNQRRPRRSMGLRLARLLEVVMLLYIRNLNVLWHHTCSLLQTNVKSYLICEYASKWRRLESVGVNLVTCKRPHMNSKQRKTKIAMKMRWPKCRGCHQVRSLGLMVVVLVEEHDVWDGVHEARKTHISLKRLYRLTFCLWRRSDLNWLVRHKPKANLLVK